MRLIMIGRIYLLKSSDRTPPYCQMALIGNCQPAQTVPKQRPKATVRNPNTWQISKNTTHMFQYCSAKVLLRFSASKAPPPSQASFSVCPCSKRPFSPARIQNTHSSLYAPKASLVFARTQSGPSRLSASRALFCVGRTQSDPLRWPVSKSPS